MADGLSREQIVSAAIELLDADGVDGLSMRKLGTRLGSGATSVYWHVGNKQNLVGLAADAVFGEVELPDPDDVGWREALVASARGLRDAIVRHGWLVPVLQTHHDIHGPRIARYQNQTVTACTLAGFTGFDVDWAAGAVFAFVLGAVWGEAVTVPEGATTGPVLDRARELAAPYPVLAERFDALAGADPAFVRERSFEFGLQAVLDGLVARLDTR